MGASLTPTLNTGRESTVDVSAALCDSKLTRYCHGRPA